MHFLDKETTRHGVFHGIRNLKEYVFSKKKT